MTRINDFTGGSSITSQGVENSAGLTSLEKVEKLKQQWLGLLS